MEKLIKEVKEEIKKEKKETKKRKVKGMLKLIESKEERIKELEKKVEKLKDDLEKGNFEALHPECCYVGDNSTTAYGFIETELDSKNKSIKID